MEFFDSLERKSHIWYKLVIRIVPYMTLEWKEAIRRKKIWKAVCKGKE